MPRGSFETHGLVVFATKDLEKLAKTGAKPGSVPRQLTALKRKCFEDLAADFANYLLTKYGKDRRPIVTTENLIECKERIMTRCAGSTVSRSGSAGRHLEVSDRQFKAAIIKAFRARELMRGEGGGRPPGSQSSMQGRNPLMDYFEEPPLPKVSKPPQET